MKDIEKKIKALIAVPTYNEEQHISRFLLQLEPWRKDVLVIDDCSNDNTVILVKSAGFSCFHRNSNQGLSGFYHTAINHAGKSGYTHLIAIDGDGQHDPQYIPEFLATLKEFDLVSGNRFHDISGIPPSKIASNMFARLLFKKYLNIELPDVACGFRAMKLSMPTEITEVSQFGIIYDMLIRNTLAGKQTGFVKIPAIYHPNDPLNTKISEISGLISTIQRYHPSKELFLIMESVKNKTDIRTSLQGFNFTAVFQAPDAYHFTMTQ